ncbi:alpha/beta hydrolase [Ancylobacter sonchi]|uniref:alpha/beta hydrolase n=1 Tax=Ancylobacter sonchi TaxID=1937790 RepID=UPI0028B2522B|nr:alpha/beta hydrolase [Ancylobacter sonchi]
MNRRELLALLTLLAGGGAVAAEESPAPRVVPLWPDTPPGGGGPQGAPDIDRRAALSNVSRPTLTLFLPERPAETVVLVAAGGGYRHIEDGKEALPAARWLAAHGLAAAVLDYRLPGEGWSAGPVVPLQDARRALQLLASGIAEPGIRRIGVLGFSSGAHLMALTAGAAPMGAYPAVDAADTASVRVDFAALIYPVLSLSEALHPTSAQRQLVGRHPLPDKAAAWSAETYVDARYPPTFLVQAADDPVSDPRQAPLMAEACRRAGVPVELDMLASGGHGFGLGRPGTPSGQWPDRFAAWLASLPL